MFSSILHTVFKLLNESGEKVLSFTVSKNINPSNYFNYGWTLLEIYLKYSCIIACRSQSTNNCERKYF